VKVAVLTQDPRGGGGAERVMSDIAAALEGECEFVMVVPEMSRQGDHDFSHQTRLVSLDLRWNEGRSVTSKTALYLVRAERLGGLLSEERPDLVVSNFSATFHRLAGFAKALGLVRAPLILRFGNPVTTEPVNNGFWSRRLLRSSAQLADRILANSSGLGRELATLFDVPSSKIRVIGNPVDIDRVRELAEEDMSEPADDRLRPMLLTAARLVPQKNLRLLLGAFGRIRDRTPARLVVAGAGPAEKELRGVADRLGLGDWVRFVGWQANPYKFMRRAAVYVLSSDYEGFGSAIVEALACATPVVATDCPYGPREVLQDGRFGLLVPPGDEEALAAAILSVLDDPALRARFASDGPRRAEDFHIDRMAARYLSLFREVAQPQPAAAVGMK
jgi:glycosyltransferase involved in cell wall biosynthesis